MSASSVQLTLRQDTTTGKVTVIYTGWDGLAVEIGGRTAREAMLELGPRLREILRRSFVRRECAPFRGN